MVRLSDHFEMCPGDRTGHQPDLEDELGRTGVLADVACPADQAHWSWRTSRPSRSLAGRRRIRTTSSASRWRSMR
jgi:hypothetical protein